ncbi:hypothetical protein CLM65_11155 [Serratia marcescens]|uniref:hypothetical protein n=1 Tax=Serratia marcescens TaxID=615 RepID=UPI000A17391C|nr:hypothetical protein [Serratia marcescens]EIV5186761.1 hypothetical protein [Serratia marcescens]EIY2711313.1 hypothetical protein [Serratia marcescens]KAB1980948.1 hypothetical protein F8B69_17480 [Serratia marcescens]OSB74243.1 hypothetical protein B7R53_10705 [Serratia marcescens]OSB79012.1 hypothetical protein B7R52_01085 [Serratia marcescens]
MPSYISELINDKTIIGACIGALFSIAGAFVAHGLSVRLESRKIKTSKKEELYEELLKLKSLIAKKRSYLFLAQNDRKEDANKLEIDKGSNIEKIVMITNLYLNCYEEYTIDIVKTYREINLAYQDAKYNNLIFDNSQKDRIEINLSRIEVMIGRLIDNIVGG